MTVQNVGGCDGEEVVQLYGRDLLASVIRPRQELIGFARVPLKKGESKRVTFSFNLDQLAFEDAGYQWVLEKGEFEFFVGGNSDDRRAAARVEQEKTLRVDPRKRSFYADAAVK